MGVGRESCGWFDFTHAEGQGMKQTESMPAEGQAGTQRTRPGLTVLTVPPVSRAASFTDAAKHRADGHAEMPYRLVADIVDQLRVHVRLRQAQQGLTQCEVARAAGLPPSTLSRLYQAQGLGTGNIVKLLQWLGTDR
jgi:hypothetical protein